MKPPLVIVLAAGRPSPTFQSIFGTSASAMAPVNGRPVLHWSLSYLIKQGFCEFLIGVNATDERLKNFAQQSFGGRAQIAFCEIKEDRGPGYSLYQCLTRVPKGRSCLIVLGDTLFEFSKKAGKACSKARGRNYVLVHPVLESASWCLAQADSKGRIVGLLDKVPVADLGHPALIGVYHLANPAPARTALARQARSSSKRIELASALKPYIAAKSLFAEGAKNWFDCGHVSFLTQSRRRLLQAREFNSLEVNDLLGVITKKSRHAEKFVNEINYYQQIPPDISCLFPRVIGHSTRPGNAFITLEYYGYSTLSEIWVFEEMERRWWSNTLERLDEILGLFSKHKAKLDSKKTFEFYWHKTMTRLETFTKQKPFAQRLARLPEITINGRNFLGWPRLAPLLEARVADTVRRSQGQVIHGDLCFPNILFDPIAGIMKLIDPRGSFNHPGIHGDGRYDAAKILHSVHGGYDFFIHDMYAVSGERNQFTVEQFRPRGAESVITEALERVGKRFRLADVLLIEALLFLSMCPLHNDDPKRQTAMFLKGIELANNLLA